MCCAQCTPSVIFQPFQYLPVSIFNLQTWLEHPCIFVWDCNYAGSIVDNYQQAMETHEA